MTSWAPATNDAAVPLVSHGTAVRVTRPRPSSMSATNVSPRANSSQPAASPRMGWPVSVNAMLGCADVG